MILGVSGPYGAGKGEVVAYLEARSFYAFSLSDVIRDELRARGERGKTDGRRPDEESATRPRLELRGPPDQDP